MKKIWIIGNPVTFFIAVLHNYWFEKYSLDASYSIIETKENDLKSVIKKIRDRELTGVNAFTI